MNKLFVFTVFIFISWNSKPVRPVTESFVLHSIVINDDYTIQIQRPVDFDAHKDYHIIYLADGSIGLGEYVLGTDEKRKAKIPDNCIVVAIGHNGNWHKKRPRDFIPSDVSNNNNDSFGNAAQFYSFLKTELIPLIDKKFSFQKSRVFIGHSFSGLFCLYAALKNDQLFDQYFAVSPSVWANDKELLKIETQFIQTNKDINSNVHIYAGGLEVFNKVLSSSKEFYNMLQEKNFRHLSISFEEISGANHFSVREPAIDKILASLSK